MKYKINDIIKCEVTGISNYGVFVKCPENYTGLIHISEISEGFVKNVTDFAKVGDIILCRIIEVDNDDNHLKLSIKNIDYKGTGKPTGILEEGNGFKPLKENLPIWTKETLDEYEKQEK